MDILSKRFRKKYKWPKDENIKRLFRFSSFTPETINYHQALFEDALLYHNLPSYFNDPFECKPIIRWQGTEKDDAALKEDIVSLLIAQGCNIEDALQRSSKIKITNENKNQVEESILTSFQSFRICCFTKRKENLLFWSHYANSHRGYCVEYSTDNKIFSQAYKVRYGTKFPVLEFPLLKDLRKLPQLLEQAKEGNNLISSEFGLDMKLLEPVLNKSLEWKYEEEFRSILMPDAPLQLNHDNESLILKGDEIKNVYFGCNMLPEHREQIIRLIKKGPFSPGLWQANMKDQKFALNFNKI
jgi:hypothetical protein